LNKYQGKCMKSKRVGTERVHRLQTVQCGLWNEWSKMLGWSGLWAADSARSPLRDLPLRAPLPLLSRPLHAPLRSTRFSALSALFSSPLVSPCFITSYQRRHKTEATAECHSPMLCSVGSTFATWNVFFTDENNFYLNPPASNQNSRVRVWATGKKADVKPFRLLVQREKFAQHVMVSAGVFFSGKGRLHFVDEKAKVDSAYYVGVEDCTRLLPTGFISSKTVHAPAHTARITQDWWLQANCPDFINKDQWPPNSPDLNPPGLSCLGGAMLEAYYKRHPKPKTIFELKEMLQSTWEGQPASGTNWQGCERISTATGGLCCSWGWTLWTFSVTVALWIWTCNVFWCRLNNVIFAAFTGTFLTAENREIATIQCL